MNTSDVGAGSSAIVQPVIPEIFGLDQIAVPPHCLKAKEKTVTTTPEKKTEDRKGNRKFTSGTAAKTKRRRLRKRQMKNPDRTDLDRDERLLRAMFA